MPAPLDIDLAVSSFGEHGIEDPLLKPSSDRVDLIRRRPHTPCLDFRRISETEQLSDVPPQRRRREGLTAARVVAPDPVAQVRCFAEVHPAAVAIQRIHPGGRRHVVSTKSSEVAAWRGIHVDPGPHARYCGLTPRSTSACLRCTANLRVHSSPPTAERGVIDAGSGATTASPGRSTPETEFPTTPVNENG